MAYPVAKSFDQAITGSLVAVKLWMPISVKSDVLPIDTLAEINIALPNTYIQEGVATSLGLEPTGKIFVSTSTKAKYEAYVFRLRVVLPDNNMVFEISAVEVPYMIRPQKRIRCLIGRDILQFGTLLYSGPANTFSLRF